MPEHTKIQWADHTWSPWWGCSRVSEACKFCYAESIARRFRGKLWGEKAPRQVVSEATWRYPILWNERARAAGTVRRVFSGSMCDIAEDRRDLDLPRARTFAMAEQTPHLVWMFLSKRPQNFERMVPPRWLAHPPPNVWYGATVEEARWLPRADALIALPAAVRFVSCEPLLSGIDFGARLGPDRIGWAIGGGESGSRARPSDPAHFRSLRDQCARAGVPYFHKQNGAWGPRDAVRCAAQKWERARVHRFPSGEEVRKVGLAAGGRSLDGREHSAVPDPEAAARALLAPLGAEA